MYETVVCGLDRCNWRAGGRYAQGKICVMGISLKTRKMLWGRAANRCAFSACRTELVIDATGTDDESLIGEECHVVARKKDGPRGVSALTSEHRDKYSNLILLCAVHHKMIDDQPGKYTVEYLHKLKKDHEAWVKDSLGQFDQNKQRDDEYYASLVEEFCEIINIDNWRNWTSFVLGGGGHPKLSKEMDMKLNMLRDWILSRIWPKRYSELEDSFYNFRLVLQDFLNTFYEHSEEFGNDMLATKRFYKITEWNPERYEKLSKIYEYHIDLVRDLIVELTRALNYICDNVRDSIFPTFRLKEGVNLVETGPYMDLSYMDLSYKTLRVEYRGDERISKPYSGIKEFLHGRQNRDWCFGEGSKPSW